MQALFSEEEKGLPSIARAGLAYFHLFFCDVKKAANEIKGFDKRLQFEKWDIRVDYIQK
jgi:hypothetical protein